MVDLPVDRARGGRFVVRSYSAECSVLERIEKSFVQVTKEVSTMDIESVVQKLCRDSTFGRLC